MFTVMVSILATHSNTLSSFVANQLIPIGASFFFFFFGTDYWLLSG